MTLKATVHTKHTKTYFVYRVDTLHVSDNRDWFSCRITPKFRDIQCIIQILQDNKNVLPNPVGSKSLIGKKIKYTATIVHPYICHPYSWKTKYYVHTYISGMSLDSF